MARLTGRRCPLMSRRPEEGVKKGRRAYNPNVRNEGDAMRSASKMSRRNFLMTSGAATVWASGTARGYSGAQMRAKAAAGDLTGVSKWDLDTPALCVDLNKLEQNL